MTVALFFSLLVVFVSGLFIGTNLGVILMCVLQFSEHTND